MSKDVKGTVKRTYKVKLYPSDNQQDKLMFMWRAVKLTYNLCIEQRLWITRTGKTPTLAELAEYWDARIEAIKAGKGDEWQHPLGELPARLPKGEDGKSKPVATISQHKQEKYLSALREARGWIGAIPAKAFYQVCADVESGYDSFFGSVKSWNEGGIPKPPKPPKFKSRRSSISIGFTNHGGVSINSPYSVYVMGVGNIHSKIAGTPKKLEPYQSDSYIRITRDKVGQWWLHVHYKNIPLALVTPEVEPGRSVGVDLGIVHLAVTSDGQYLANTRPLNLVIDKIRRTDKALSRLLTTYLRRNNLKDTPHNRKMYSREAWGSIKGRQLRMTKNKLLRYAGRARRHMIDTAVHRLLSSYDTICLEDLNIKGLGKGRLARHIKDVGWGIFYKRLQDKADEAGAVILYVNPLNTSRECSECGYTAKDNRVSQSVFRCGRCEHATNADENAAKNVLSRALQNANLGTQKTSRKRTYKRSKQKSVKPTQDAAR